eukprot:TRINITY_DN261_c1_g1_i1.p1 TRINITY_DN261_c1_g1~~TRINITY_DN261_c1_g1_i1.p1  ORF type:complete len:171 (+),score=73.60 TRINITY_DN261_c1_g1_i1:26-514(+)
MDIDSSSSSSSSSRSDISKEFEYDIKVVSNAVLGAITAKSKLLATKEDTIMKNLITDILELQVKKLELKLLRFENIEQQLQKSKEGYEQLNIDLEKEKESLMKELNSKSNPNSNPTTPNNINVPDTNNITTNSTSPNNNNVIDSNNITDSNINNNNEASAQI